MPPRSDLLIDPDELVDEIGGPRAPLVIDARRADEFARGQIAGAVHLDP